MLKEIGMRLLSDPLVWSVILAFVLYLVTWTVKKTATKKDDEALKLVMGFIHNAFNVAEKSIPDDATGRLSKIDVALKAFNADYERRFGESAPQKLVDQAKAEWAILATEIKKAKG
jgi:hypothetical protein